MKTISENDEAFVCDIQAPCFQALSNEEADFIRASKTQILFKKGENLTKQGTFASYIMFVTNGLVKLYVEGDATRNYNIRVIRAGEFIGLSSVFTRSIFMYSTSALTDTRVFLIEKDAIANVVKKNGNFGYSIIRRYFEHNDDLYDSIRNLVYKQMNGRLADALLYLSSEEFENDDLFNKLSRKDIADFAGLSTESTVKLLKAYEKDAILKLDEKDIKIINRPALVEIGKRG